MLGLGRIIFNDTDETFTWALFEEGIKTGDKVKFNGKTYIITDYLYNLDDGYVDYKACERDETLWRKCM